MPFFRVIALLLSLQLVANQREEFLISHVVKSIELGWKEESKLNKKVLKLKGMSSAKNRHFLNNLCSLPTANYLEIGCWKGSTWVSALYGNLGSLNSAVAIDDWSEFGGPINEFHSNSARFLGTVGYSVYSADCFAVDVHQLFHKPVNIYFYDGEHSELHQEMAFTYFNDILDDVFIAVVDDWNWEHVQRGTRTAFEKLHYEILFEEFLPAKVQGDLEQWWNGLYVAVIRKPKSW